MFWFKAAVIINIMMFELFAEGKMESEKPFSFGIVADCQYAPSGDTKVRKFSESNEKLQASVDRFNALELAFVIQLGDLIDRDAKSYQTILPVFNRIRHPKYHVLGNHDYFVDDALKQKIPELLGMPSNYYTFNEGTWRFVVLDGNALSLHAYSKKSGDYRKSKALHETEYKGLATYNGAIDAAQLHWLDETLQAADEAGEKVIVFGHFPVYPEDHHNLWNDDAVVEILQKHPCVKAFLCGHNHAGNYALKEGIHYLNFKGMVDTHETAYAVVTVKKDALEVEGFGREANRTLRLSH